MIEQSEPVTAERAELERRFVAMPKAEIHVHLEGATAPDASYAIAQRNHVELPVATLEEWKHYFEFRDFPHFIDVYRKTTDTIRTTDDLALMIAQFYVDQARQNIRYSECFMSMSLHLRRLKPAEILDAMAQGIERGRTVSGTKVRFIADIAREDVELQGDVLDLALWGQKRGLIIGLGLGGLEKEFPPHLFTETYKKAADAGLHVVAHAGEAAGVESIKAAGRRAQGHAHRSRDPDRRFARIRRRDAREEHRLRSLSGEQLRDRVDAERRAAPDPADGRSRVALHAQYRRSGDVQHRSAGPIFAASRTRASRGMSSGS